MSLLNPSITQEKRHTKIKQKMEIIDEGKIIQFDRFGANKECKTNEEKKNQLEFGS